MPKIDMIEFHMAAAHFPIALLMSSLLFDVSALTWRRDDLKAAAFWTLILGMAGGMVTLALGLLGNPFREDMAWIGNPFRAYEQVMVARAVRHQWVGLGSLIVFGLLAAWRLRRPDLLDSRGRWVYLAAAAAGAVLVGLAGYLGAHVMD